MATSATLRGPWSQTELDTYLSDCATPLRIACHTPGDYPALLPLWFVWREEAFWCATHQSARVLDYLRQDERVGFEVANNHPPYYGVRGHGRVELLPGAGGHLLEELLAKYLPGQDTDFTRWLLSRRHEEYALCLTPQRLSVWDYRPRMDGGKDR